MLSDPFAKKEIVYNIYMKLNMPTRRIGENSEILEKLVSDKNVKECKF